MGQRPDIILAKSAGFCFGVDRAVKTVFKSVDESKLRVYTLGEVIHNNTINNELKEKGVIIENDYKKIPKNADVVIRAHGVPEKVYTYFEVKHQCLSLTAVQLWRTYWQIIQKFSAIRRCLW